MEANMYLYALKTDLLVVIPDPLEKLHYTENTEGFQGNSSSQESFRKL